VVFERDRTEAVVFVRKIAGLGRMPSAEDLCTVELIVDDGSPHNGCVKGNRRVISNDDSRLRYHILDIDLRVGTDLDMVRQSQFRQIVLKIGVRHEHDPALVFRGHLLKFGGLQYVHPATQEIRFEEVTVRKPSIATADCFSDQKLAPSRHDSDDRPSVEDISSGLLYQNVV